MTDMMNTEDIMRLEGLSTGYDGKVVSADVALSLSRGRLCALIGRNGAGKSTLIRTACGFIKAISGRVIFRGKDIERYSHTEIARSMSVVLTERASELNYLSVRDVIETGRYPYCDCFARLSPADHDAVDDAIRTVGIGDLENKNMSSLSDGQTQKVMIARALAQDTEVIILDEPLSFLDMPSRIEIMELLRDIAHTKNKSILMSSHDMELALHFADTMWVISHPGKTYQIDAPWEDVPRIIDDVFGDGGSSVKDFLKI